MTEVPLTHRALEVAHRAALAEIERLRGELAAAQARAEGAIGRLAAACDVLCSIADRRRIRCCDCGVSLVGRILEEVGR